MSSEFPFAVLWPVYFITGNDLGVYLFRNFKGIILISAQINFDILEILKVCFHLLASPIILLPLSASPVDT
jgi:hypothetical protein